MALLVELDRIVVSEGPAQARHGEYIEDGAYLVSMGV